MSNVAVGRWSRIGMVIVAAIATVAMIATPVQAAFPGENGRIAFHRSEDGSSDIYLINSEGGDLRNLTEDPTASDAWPSWSPDGQKIVFGSDRNGSFEIYVMDFDGTDVVQLTDGDGSSMYPAWSPDGSKIAFSRHGVGGTEIWVMNADGSDPTNLTNSPGDDLFPTWSPDGTKIAFVSDREMNFDIFVMNADGSAPTNLTAHPAADLFPDWSPDGSEIVFISTRADWASAVWVMLADGTGTVQLTEGPDDEAPVFSPDGMSIAFRRRSDGESHVWVMSANGSDAAPVTGGEARDYFPDWQPVIAGENVPPTADAGYDETVGCAGPDGATVTLDGSGSFDPDSSGEVNDIVLFDWYEDYGLPTETHLGTGEILEVTLPLGSHVVTLLVTDSVGQTDTDEVVKEVVDGDPPVISVSLDPSVLWPPNHKMVEVRATVVASDTCGDAAVILESVVSDEPDDSNGKGAGHTRDDIQGADVGTADFEFMLRAERSGLGDGRTYTVTYRATDAAGNSATASGVVFVPHSAEQSPEATSGAGNGPKEDAYKDPRGVGRNRPSVVRRRDRGLTQD